MTILTRKEVMAWFKEIADSINAEAEAMTPEERKEFFADLNKELRQMGGFPEEEEEVEE